LIHSPPEIILLAVDLYKNFVDKESVTEASVFPSQSSGVDSTEFDTP
jgi:hypothetical protein